MSRITNKSRADILFIRADKEADRGRMKSAFRLMLAAAKLGDIGAQVNVGNYYDAGSGIRRNCSAALYWYKRAYRRGDSCAANNIGVLWRNEKKFQRALYWFFRSVRLGDEEANIEIGKHYLYNENNPRKAILYFKRVKPTGWVSEAGAEEAAELLKEAKKQLKIRRHPTVR
jgi:TPR repeat protein